MELQIGIETEKPRKYRPGGFCPVDIGDLIADRFVVLHKLGYGGFGTVWLVRDDENRYVALKIISAAWFEDYEPPAVFQKLRHYERENGFPGLFLVELERVFHNSRNGRHLCQVFPVLGPPLSTLNNRKFFLYPSFVKGFARQLATALDATHSLGICLGGTLLSLRIRALYC
jgi:serine/threonine protein kinase